MREQLLLIAFLFLPFILSAQPTLSDSWIPEAGDSWNLRILQDSVDAGQAGANITWDFTFLNPDDFNNSFEINWIQPSEGIYSDSFPNATIASTFEFFGFTNESYYEVSGGSFYELGSSNSSFTTIYTDPRELRYIDLQFDQMQDDDYMIRTYGFGDPGQAVGTTQWHYDAYGTLILPGGKTLNDVIRIEQNDLEVDSTTGAFSIVTISKINNYNWFAQGAVLPVAQIQRSEIITRTYANGVLISEEEEDPEFSFAFSADIVSTSIPEVSAKNQLTVHPNLTTSEVNVRLKASVEGANYVIHNITGKRVRSGYITTGSNLLNLSDLENGYYLLNVEGFLPKRICKID